MFGGEAIRRATLDCSGPYTDPAAQIDIPRLPALREPGFSAERYCKFFPAPSSRRVERLNDPNLAESASPQRNPRRSRATSTDHYARKGIITPEWNSSHSARTCSAEHTSKPEATARLPAEDGSSLLVKQHRESFGASIPQNRAEFCKSEVARAGDHPGQTSTTLKSEPHYHRAATSCEDQPTSALAPSASPRKSRRCPGRSAGAANTVMDLFPPAITSTRLASGSCATRRFRSAPCRSIMLLLKVYGNADT